MTELSPLNIQVFIYLKVDFHTVNKVKSNFLYVKLTNLPLEIIHAYSYLFCSFSKIGKYAGIISPTHKFLLSIIGVEPHHNQAKTNKYPKTRKLTSSGENEQFFCFGGIIKFLS